MQCGSSVSIRRKKFARSWISLEFLFAPEILQISTVVISNQWP